MVPEQESVVTCSGKASAHVTQARGTRKCLEIEIAGRLQQHVEALYTARVKRATHEVVIEARQTGHRLNPH